MLVISFQVGTMKLDLVYPNSIESLQQVRHILLQYAALRNHDKALGDYQGELDQLPGEYAPPAGRLLLASWQGEPAGVVAYRRIGHDFCEMKRMFVLPEFQGKGIGKALGIRLIEEAQKAGFVAMRLDTHPWMTTAQGLYEKLGFVEIDRYNDNPTEGIRFFELNLTDS